MEDMEYIEDYFKGSPDAEQKQQFEQRIQNDISFAEKVAFYISASGVIREQMQQGKKQKFRELYHQQKVISIAKHPVKKILRYMAAACAVAAIMLLTWFLPGEKRSPQRLADQYIQQNFQTLSTTMGNPDSLQTGLNLFNSQKFAEALAIFENLAKNDPTGNAKKYAGIVALRLENYDKALTYFTRLETDPGLYSNPGKIYKAVTLLKRNKTGDKDAAKLLLQEVVAKDLEGSKLAREWLKKL